MIGFRKVQSISNSYQRNFSRIVMLEYPFYRTEFTTTHNYLQICCALNIFLLLRLLKINFKYNLIIRVKTAIEVISLASFLLINCWRVVHNHIFNSYFHQYLVPISKSGVSKKKTRKTVPYVKWVETLLLLTYHVFFFCSS